MAKKEPRFTESAVGILRKRYLDEEETIEERFRAVAETVNPERADEYYELMINRDFLPNTPTIVNAGRGSGQLSACFVLPVNDSMHDILMAAYNVGMIQKTGGGTGFTLSRLRPKGALVSSTRGTSSGPISFLHMYNAVTNTIKQGGVRRGANMATMRVDHPDILEFITCKNVEGELSNFNISVMLTDLFMEAVKDGTEVSLIYKGKFYKNMPARELFDKIAKQAWLNGEPGVIFIDTINKAHPEGLGNIDATNPCVAAFERVLTKQGWLPIQDVHTGMFVMTDNGWREVLSKWSRGTRDVVTVTTRGGYTITCTPEHKIKTSNGWIEARDLQGERVVLNNCPAVPPGGNYNQGYLDGMIFGDGWVSTRVGFVNAARGTTEIVAALMNKLFGTSITTREHVQRNGSPKYQTQTGKKEVMQYYKEWRLEEVKNQGALYIQGFLEGLLECDGHIEASNGLAIALSTSNEEMIKEFPIILSTLGVAVNKYRVKRKGHKSDLSYGINPENCKDSYKFLITAGNRDKLTKFINLPQRLAEKYNPVRHHESVNTTEVLQVESMGEAVVYDLTVDEHHNFVCNGIIVANCGEQPLLDYESCNLGSINLVNMLKHNSTANKYEIDFSKLRDTTIKATAFLDDVISVNKFVLPEIGEATLRTRKIGLGVMGWGDVLVKLKIPYGSEESLLQAATVMRVISEAANEESKNRAKLFGPYPAWTLLQGSEIRNATRTTIAPTGSLAAIAGVSWGIEPLFGLTFRKTMLDEEFVYVNEEFKKAIHALELTSEQEVALFEEVKKTGSCQHIEDVPKEIKAIFKTAQDLSYKEHIMMQEAFQRFTDNAVSKTINLHNNATVEDVKDAIKLAHRLGCKGLTLYRAGTRKEEAVSVGMNTRELSPHMKPKERPKRVYGFTEKQQTGCGKLYVTVNSAESGKPIEVFIEPGSDGGCEAYGKALSRTISLGLRAGVSPEEYVRQLKKVSCKNFIRKAANGKLVGKSCPDVVGRILQTALKTIAAETKSKSKGETSPCPNCGRPLISAEGCWVCTECGFSECNG